MKSRIIYSKSLVSAAAFPAETLLFYDSVLVKNKFFKSWVKTFRYSLPLKAGEQLKTLEGLQQVLNKISKLDIPKSTKLTFVAAGGGSLGDFTGFLASVFLRGRSLVLVPSTWLAAVDSAHGGKNGLNFLKTKNQIGTFYAPEKIYICDELLLSQPKARLIESLGEVIKTAIIADKKLFGELEQRRDSSFILKQLPNIIRHKYKIVGLDPFEKKGLRRILNLGHTLGHVFESYYGWAHGLSVLLGLQFSARWSFARGDLSEKEFFRISLLIDSLELDCNLNSALQQLPAKRIRTLLAKDKKITEGSSLDFIFIRRLGQVVRKSVSIEQIMAEVERQKRVY